MGKFNTLLNLRLKQKSGEKNKVKELAEKSKSGTLSSFSGVFRISSLTLSEKERLHTLLKGFSKNSDYFIEDDLKKLILLTSEVKAITNQAIILHGERIKKAQETLSTYKEGAFSYWLITTYGNRQTPYNFLQYYEFYMSMPQEFHPKIDQMPRQAIYTLASREGPLAEKKELVATYQGESKQELLLKIRKIFPLAKADKRLSNNTRQVVSLLKKLQSLVESPSFFPNIEEKIMIKKLIQEVEKKL